jgi:hypothetical protein
MEVTAVNRDRQSLAAHKANRAHGQETLKAQNLAREKSQAQFKRRYTRQPVFGNPMAEILMEESMLDRLRMGRLR